MKPAGRRVNRPRPSSSGSTKRTVTGVVDAVDEDGIEVAGVAYRVLSASSCWKRDGCPCADHLDWPDAGDRVRLEVSETSRGNVFVDSVEILERGEAEGDELIAMAPDPAAEERRLRAAAMTAAASWAPEGWSERQVVECAGRWFEWIYTGEIPDVLIVRPAAVAEDAPTAATPAAQHQGIVETVGAAAFRVKGSPKWWPYVKDYAGMRVTEGQRIRFDVDPTGKVVAVREYTP